MSEDDGSDGAGRPNLRTARADERLSEFTRRALVRAGWTTPIILAATLPAHAQQSPHDDTPHDDTPHNDTPHNDAPHDDHDDAGHDDTPHDDTPHDDTPHDDHDDTPHDDHDDVVHDDVPHEDHDDTPHDDHDDAGHDDTPHDDHDDTPHDDHDDTPHDDHDDTPCNTVGQLTCGGITFIASAVMTSFESKCQESTQWTECCDTDETVRFEEPCQASLTISHNHTVNLNIKVDYFTHLSPTCKNESSFQQYNNVPPNTPTNVGSVGASADVQGDSPECTGFRIVEVKETVSGTEITDCKPTACPQGDLGIYAILLPNGGSCPSADSVSSSSRRRGRWD